MRKLAVLALLIGVGCGGSTASPDAEQTGSVSAALGHAVPGPHSVSFDFAHPNVFFPAGVAVDSNVVFVGSPLEGRVVALSRLNGAQIGELPQPPGGFVLPFIMHMVGPSTVAILDAGGFPNPDVNCAQGQFPCPSGPDPSGVANAIPNIFEYQFSYSPFTRVFQASLTRTISFASVPGITYGFSEDMVRLHDGGYLVSDAVYGSIWRVTPNGTVVPGIVPRTFSPADQIPQMAFWNCQANEPLVNVAGLPFEFGGNSTPGVSPIAVRNGTVYFYTPCTGGLYKFPLASLFDERRPDQRAADIQLISTKSPDVRVEELLELQFNQYDPFDRYLYAADALELRIIRIDPDTGARTVVANDPTLFNWPASLSFAPPFGAELFVISNQQHRTWITNNFLSTGTDLTQRPYILTDALILP
jgi:hypothetical protein